MPEDERQRSWKDFRMGFVFVSLSSSSFSYKTSEAVRSGFRLAPLQMVTRGQNQDAVFPNTIVRVQNCNFSNPSAVTWTLPSAIALSFLEEPELGASVYSGTALNLL